VGVKSLHGTTTIFHTLVVQLRLSRLRIDSSIVSVHEMISNSARVQYSTVCYSKTLTNVSKRGENR